MDAEAAMDAIKDALQDPAVSICIVHTFTHGRAAQVRIKSRKIGPLLFPAEGEDISHVLAMLGSLAVSS